jgi:hypothetical protein
MSDSHSSTEKMVRRIIGALFCVVAAIMIIYEIPKEFWVAVGDFPVWLSWVLLITAVYLLREAFKQEVHDEEE